MSKRLSQADFESVLTSDGTKRMVLAGGTPLTSDVTAAEGESVSLKSSQQSLRSNNDDLDHHQHSSTPQLQEAQEQEHERSRAAHSEETGRESKPVARPDSGPSPAQQQSIEAEKQDALTKLEKHSEPGSSSNNGNKRPSSAAGSFVLVPDSVAGTNMSSSQSSQPSSSTTIHAGQGTSPQAHNSRLPGSSSSSSSSSSWSNTMRKTSGFFKRRFGQSQHQSGSTHHSSASGHPLYSNSNRSSPNQPGTSLLREKHSAPQVPPIPATYSNAASADRRRSASLSQMAQQPHTISNSSSSSAAVKARGAALPASANEQQQGSDEDERLDRALRSVDWDDLASRLDAEPQQQQQQQQASAADKDAAAYRSHVSSANYADQPFGQLPLRQSAAAEQRRSSQEDAPPSIRLVPSPRSPAAAAAATSNAAVTPKMHQADDQDNDGSNQPTPQPSPRSPATTTTERRGSSDVKGLGLGLDSISESARPSSREGSIETTRPLSAVRKASSGTSPRLPHSSTANSLESLKPATSGGSQAQSLMTTLSPARTSTSSLHRSPGTSSPATTALSAEEPELKAVEAGQKCWAEDEAFIKKHKIAEFLGSSDLLSDLARKEYMKHFDFVGLRLDVAFRRLCDKLYLKAETQQVDRILDEFSQKYYVDNLDCPLPSADMVHQVVYSVLLLNTDLHVADVSSHMSRQQFIKNTMSTIHGHAFSSSAVELPQITRIKSADARSSSNSNLIPNPLPSPAEELNDTVSPPSPNTTREREKTAAASTSTSSPSGPKQRRGSGASHDSSELPDARGSPARTRSYTSRGWEAEVETLLKEMYSDIKSNPIYLPGAPSTSNLSAYSTWSGSSRSANRRSQISLATGQSPLYLGKRSSMRTFLAHPSTDSFRPTSPTPSTMTSLSDGSNPLENATTAAGIMRPTQPQTIGFASNLSHSIIRERHDEGDEPENEKAAEESASESGVEATDEELALLGAPWAKEGLLQRKHYWESPKKRSKDKNWTQVFVVISRGDFQMFTFGDASKGAKAGGSGMGGGNWLSNANSAGQLALTHSLACAMPPPGYNASRRHVMVLTLSSGSSWFFQAGTEELVHEWVSTCNYWAARLSKEPLTGGVSNMEYGWNAVLPTPTSPDPAGEEGEDDAEELEDVRSTRSGKSVRSTRSYQSRLSKRGASAFAQFASPGSYNPNDRLNISEWTPPQPPSAASTLSEEDQHKALQRYQKTLQGDLEVHNELRGPMARLYSSRSVNASKSAANWEKKSSYLLAEIVKYTTYLSALEEAIRLRQTKTAEKTVDKMLRSADEGDEDAQESLEAMGKAQGDHPKSLVMHPQEAGSFVDVTAPVGYVGDAPLAGIRRTERESMASLGSYDTEYHDSGSVSTRDVKGSRQSQETTV